MNIIFIYDKTADGRSAKVVGILSEEGAWQGHPVVELGVRELLREENVDLKNSADRQRFLKRYFTSRQYGLEESEFTGEVRLGKI